MKRTARAIWQGSGKEGKGHLSTQSSVLKETQYSYKSRFEEGIGTNPEELIAAAHAGCFAMKLSFVLVAAGFEAKKLDASCEISLEAGSIEYSKITLVAEVPGIDKKKFDEAVAEAEVNCPISKLLKTKISVVAELKN